MINLDTLAEAIRKAYEPYHSHPLQDWDTIPDHRKEKWRKMAARAAEVLGVELT